MNETDNKKVIPWLNRRDFIGMGVLATATVLVSRMGSFFLGGGGKKLFGALAKTPKPLVSDSALKDSSPIQEVSSLFRQKTFSGDNPSRAHSVLWQIDKAMAGIVPESIEKQEVVVIGGGISGLLTAYEVRTKKPVVLEQANQFGGNAKAESWNGTLFALGSSYMSEPEADSRIAKVFKELGILHKGRVKDEKVKDPVWVNGKIYPSFWSFETDPKLVPIYERVKKHFLDFLNSENGKKYPNFPPEGIEDWSNLKNLDQRSFMEEVKVVAKDPIPPALQNAIEHYAWSSMGASATQVSAAAAINFYASEFGNIKVFPGGNATLTSALYQKLLHTLPKYSLRPQSLVARVKKGENGKISVFYFDETQALRQIDADKVVFACSKYIVQKIYPELDETRNKVFSEIEYSSYLVANVLLKQKSRSQNFYDLYRLDEANGKFVPHGKGNIAEEAKNQKTTDLIWATWATDNNVEMKQSALSLFRAIPHPHGRQDILADNAYTRYKSEFENEVSGKILPTLGIPIANVEDVRITRWGHPLPIAKKGLYSDQRLEKACSPIDNKIFFANQDNWALPAFENAAAAVFAAADQILKNWS